MFTRSNRGVTLTNDGAELLGYARQVIEQTDMLEAVSYTHLRDSTTVRTRPAADPSVTST